MVASDLSMAKQVSSVCQACIITVRCLRRLAPLISRATLHSAVLATVISRMDYGNALYAGIASQLLHRLQTIQNDAVRLICQVLRYLRATPLLQELHWLPMAQRVIFKVMCLVHKLKHNTVSGPLAKRSVPYLLTRSLRSADADRMTTPWFHKSTMGARAFSVWAPKYWNTLLPALRNEVNFPKFRKLLKTHLFSLSLA